MGKTNKATMKEKEGKEKKVKEKKAKKKEKKEAMEKEAEENKANEAIEAISSDVPTASSEGEEEYEVERVMGMRYEEDKDRWEYFVKWRGFPYEDNTWHPEEHLKCKDLIEEYRRYQVSLIGRHYP